MDAKSNGQPCQSFEALRRNAPLPRPEYPGSRRKSRSGDVTLAVLLAVFLVPILLSLTVVLFFCAGTYSDIAEQDCYTFAYGYWMGFHKMLGQNHASVIEVRCGAGEQDNTITIPESYNGIPIRELGGVLGRGVSMPFRIKTVSDPRIDELTEQAGVRRFASSLNEDAFDEVICEDVILSIGSQIEKIRSDDTMTVFRLPDGRSVAYCIRVYVICDKDNPNFYSQDGVLYNRDGTVFDGFIYVGQEPLLRAAPVQELFRQKQEKTDASRDLFPRKTGKDDAA